jgi:autotransporter adhesin
VKYLLLFILLLPFTSEADNKHHQGEQGPQGEQGEQGPQGDTGSAGVAGTAGVDSFKIDTNSLLSGYADEDYVDGVTAGFMAVSQIDFSSSTSAWQVGVGVGYYESENAIAFGVGKLLPDQDILLKGTITNINSDNAYGAGLMWKIQ